MKIMVVMMMMMYVCVCGGGEEGVRERMSRESVCGGVNEEGKERRTGRTHSHLAPAKIIFLRLRWPVSGTTVHRSTS